MSTFDGARVALAVTGGIAAYKAVDLASRLVQAGASLDVIMTHGATKFVTPLTFAAVSRGDVWIDPFDGWDRARAGHVTVAARADVLAVVPATANAVARLAVGLAEDLLGMVALATTAPIVLAPAMEHHMLHHPATQANLATLAARGAIVVPPETGRLASGATGDGRLAGNDTIFWTIANTLGRAGPLAGLRVVVTAAGTHEAIDPVRYVGNRSSGRMGYALAVEARRRGASVLLVSGPSALPDPVGCDVVRVESALQMLKAVEDAAATADVLVMAAAVADFRPEHAADHKLKKVPGEEHRSLTLVRNPDILATVTRPGLVKVGFAAETEDLIANAERKLAAKSLDLIVANDAVASIGTSESSVTLVAPGTPPESLPTMAKEQVAAAILDRLPTLVAARRGNR